MRTEGALRRTIVFGLCAAWLGACGSSSSPGGTGGATSHAGAGGNGDVGGAGTGGTGTGGTVAAACTGTPPASLAAGSVCPSPACRACEAANCDPTLSGCGSLPTGSSNRSVCDALELCIRLAHCTVNGSESPCYCGTATQLQCPAGLGINGPCKAQFEAADPNVVALGPSATDAQKAAVLTVDLTNPALAVGLVGNLVNCDTGVCYTANACGGQF